MRRGRGQMSRHAFTFAEVLAAMVLVGIVLPVVVRGVVLAGRAGVISQQRRIATRLADNLLTSLVATDEWLTSADEGDFGEEWPGFSWQLQTEESGLLEGLVEVSVHVSFAVEEQTHWVSLSTLADGGVQDETDWTY